MQSSKFYASGSARVGKRLQNHVSFRSGGLNDHKRSDRRIECVVEATDNERTSRQSPVCTNGFVCVCVCVCVCPLATAGSLMEGHRRRPAQ